MTQAARALGVSRQALNNLITGRSGISPEMALRLEMVFGSTAQAWLRLQTAYDLSRLSVADIEVHPELAVSTR